MDRFLNNYGRIAVATLPTIISIVWLIMFVLIDEGDWDDVFLMGPVIGAIAALSVFLWGWALKRTPTKDD